MARVIPAPKVRYEAAIPWIALVIVWTVWGSTYLAIRVVVQTFPPLLMAGARSALGGLLLCAACLLWGRSRLRHFRLMCWKSVVIMAFLLIFCGYGTLCVGEQRLASGVASLTVATEPLWITAIDAFRRRSLPSRITTFSLLLGALGTITLIEFRSGSISIASTLVVLFGTLAWALGSVYASAHCDECGTPLTPPFEMLIGGTMLIALGVATGETTRFNVHAISRDAVLGFLWLVGAGAVLGYSAYRYCLATLPPRISATYAYVDPVIAVVLGCLVLGEPITANELVGGSAIVMSVVALLVSQPKTKERDQRT